MAAESREMRFAKIVAAGIKPIVRALQASIRELEARVAELEARPSLKYLGVWREETQYPAGSVVTHQGSAWTAKEATYMRPGAGATPWQLMVKAGRDGKDAR